MAPPRRCLRCGHLIPSTDGEYGLGTAQDIECICPPIVYSIDVTVTSNTVPKEEKKKQQKGNFRRKFGGVDDRLDKRFK